MRQQVLFRHQQLAAEDALGEGADHPQAERLTELVLHDQIVAEAEVQNPLHGVGIADYRYDAGTEVLVQQRPRVGGVVTGRVGARVSGRQGGGETEAAARHQLGVDAEQARVLWPVEVEAAGVIAR